ncbi:MAG: DUF1464 family protein [candidate division WOR-3 bacterium]|nr:DUF1464 family protein [candidate division WOR-3 bacterium]
MKKIIGIDPGTKSFDLYGVQFYENNREVVFLDLSIPTDKVAQNPEIILDPILKHLPVDGIIGPSGYGLPITKLQNATAKDLELILPLEQKSAGGVSVNEGIKKLFYKMKKLSLPVYFTPGVIHLPTVPYYRKLNKMDMGTADKLCIVALAIKDQIEQRKIPVSKTSFILLEMGFGFTSGIAVKNGKVIDGLGGTSGFPGFLGSGHLDGELAIRFNKMPQKILFQGGAQSLLTHPINNFSELVQNKDAFNLLIESALKDIACLLISHPKPYELILSGRLTRELIIKNYLLKSLKQHFPTLAVRSLNRKAKVAKEAAEGAVILGAGLLGVKYQEIVESLEINKAQGTMYDYIKLLPIKK